MTVRVCSYGQEQWYENVITAQGVGLYLHLTFAQHPNTVAIPIYNLHVSVLVMADDVVTTTLEAELSHVTA